MIITRFYFILNTHTHTKHTLQMCKGGPWISRVALLGQYTSFYPEPRHEFEKYLRCEIIFI